MTALAMLPQVVSDGVAHLTVPFWNLGTILAILVQSGILVRWATRLEAKVDSEAAKTAEATARHDARLTVLERNGSPAVKSLGQYLTQEQEGLERVMRLVEDLGTKLAAHDSRLTRLETTCALHHGEHDR